MRTFAIFAAVGLTLVAAPAVIAADEPAAKAKSAEKGGPNEVICRRVEETGSFRRIRRCYTRAQWDRLAIMSRDNSPGSSSMSGGSSTSN